MHKNVYHMLWIVLGTVVFGPDISRAYTVSQTVGSYRDVADGKRQVRRQDLALGLASKHSVFDAALTEIGFSVLAKEQRFSEPYIDDPESFSEGQGRDMTLSLIQTWNRLTETRQSTAWTTSGLALTKSRVSAVGVSQWVHEETVRLSMDVTQTITEAASLSYLDYDSELITPPDKIVSRTLSLGLRHLATPTTIYDIAIQRSQISNRPDAYVVGGGLKQFIPVLDGALVLQGARYRNEGKLTRETTYGNINASDITMGWVQNLWRGGLAMVDYRYYREDEVTRAYDDEYVFGSDTVEVGTSQEWKTGEQVYRVAINGARYKTNTAIEGRSVTFGLEAEL